MTPEFALFLSPDGIALAHRQPAGHWAVLADTALDVPDLPAALTAMRQRGEERAGPGFATLVFLPDDQILFTSLTAPGPDDADRLEQIHDGLDGLTPYAIADLAFDFVPLEDGRVKLAVVARETLAEAEGFARENGFEPVGFAARPLDNRYPGVAHFDRSPDWTATITDIEFGHDSWRKSSDTPEDTGEEGARDPEGAEAVEERAPVPAETPAADALQPQAESAAATADPQDSPTVEPAAPDMPGADATEPGETLSEPLPGADAKEAAAPSDATGDDGDQATEVPAPEPLAPPDRADKTAAAAPGMAAAPDAPLQMPSGFGAGRSHDAPPDSAADRVGSRPSRLAMGAAAAPASPPDLARKPAADSEQRIGKPRFGRGLSKPDAAADATPARPVAAGPAPDLPPLTRTKLSTRRKGKEEAAPPQRPALALSPDAEIKGPQAASDTAARPSARDRLSGMGKRLSAGAEKARETASGLAAGRRQDTAAAPENAPESAGVGSITARLKTLGRKPRKTGARGTDHSGNTPDTAATAQTANARLSPADIAPPPARKPRLPAAKRARAAMAAPGLTDADASLTGGLLGRKNPDSRGGTLRAGLILTLILLAVLGLIAIWAVFYLPDTALARWLGLGNGQAAIEQADGAPQVSDTPQLSSAPPDITETDPTVASLTPEASAPQVSGQVPQPPDLLPDIDADLDLGPTPVAVPRVDPETLLPSVAEAEEFYALTGIWQRPPVIDLPVPETALEDVLLAGLDPPVASFDAYALPVPGLDQTADLPRRQSSPVDPATEFVFDDNGLVVPTPEGTLNPDGILIIAGEPVLTPPQRPGDAPAAALAAEGAEAAEAADPTAGAIDTALLGTRRPTGRPVDLQEQRERALLGGITFAELGQIRPEGRPASIQEIAAAEAEAAHAQADADAEAAEITSTSEWAVAVSFVPRARPGNINEIVATARAASPTGDTQAVASTAGAASAVAPVAARPSDTVQPDIPSSASVTRAATRENAINLHRINLIGVTGSDSDRRALVRLPSGRFVTVGSGDRLDGGRVAAVGDRTLQYVKSGRTITLEIPSG